MNELPNPLLLLEEAANKRRGKAPLTRCEGCPHGFAPMVGSRGDPDSPFVIVGESPGAQEIKVGEPFIGPSGKVLQHALESIDPAYRPYNPLMLNAIQCFPGTKTKDPTKIEIATRCCQKRLYDEIKKAPRRVILALGNPAVWSTTEQFGAKITQVRGRLFPSQGLSEYGTVASVHPAFLLRGGGSMRQFMADVDFAARLSAYGAKAHKRHVLPRLHVASTADNIRWLADQIGRQEYVAADIETGGYDGFDLTRDRILCVGFCWDPNDVYMVPEHLVPLTKQIFEKTKPRFIWHFGKFDTRFFQVLSIPARVDEDTGLLSYALDETKGIHDLEQLAGDILGFPDWKFMIKEYVTGKNKTYADIPVDILHDYAAKDISGTMQIFPIMRAWVRSDPLLEKLYTKTLIPMSKYMAKIEIRGMQPDLIQVGKMDVAMTATANKYELEFNQYAIDAGFGALNPRSPKQVGAFLYDHLALRDPRKPKRRPDSTDEDTLITLTKAVGSTEFAHPCVKSLLNYREVQKGLSTYVRSIPEHVGGDGRIHTSYLIHGTTTGRPASRNPNILNIPRDPSLRGQFIAAPGKLLIEIDVNQAELRVLAELSRDPELVYIYTTPGAPSIHKVTQTEMFGDPESYDETQWNVFMDKFSAIGDKERTLDEQNMRAKCVNFGIVYGRTAPSIAEEFKMPVTEAQEWINRWFRKYSVAREFILSCRNAPLKGQNLITPFGRKRRFQIVSQERLNDIQNQAANFPEQSIAVDCVTHCGMSVQEMAKDEYDADIVNTVYDSLMFELPADTEKALELGARVLKRLSEIPREWGLSLIPFKGDIKLGTRWGAHSKELDPAMGYMKKVPIPDHIKQKVGL